MSNLTNGGWEGREVFEKQLELNMKELSTLECYPLHWKDFILMMIAHDKKEASIIDIGCGVGTYGELCKRHLPGIRYYGIDQSEDAIDIADETWGCSTILFGTHDYRELNKNELSGFNLIHMGAFLDILPEGDEALEFILDISPCDIAIGRISFTSEPSYYKKYTAYDTIETGQYYHNYDNYMKVIAKHGYELTTTAFYHYLSKVKNEQ